MSKKLVLLILASITMSALAQVALKYGANSAARAGTGLDAKSMMALLTAPFSLVGLALYGLSALLWLRVLSQAELSVAYAFVGLSFILTLCAGAWFFDERITLMRICGTVLISVGVLMVAATANSR